MSAQMLRGRAAALMILAIVLTAVWLGPIDLYLGFVGDRAQQIEESRSILRRYRSLVAEEADAARGRRGASPILLTDIPDGPTLAALQESVKDVAAGNQVELQSLQVLRSENVSGASKLGVRIRGSGEIGGIAQMLYALESARPVLYPDNVSIRSRPDAAGKPGARLDLQLDVSGFKPGFP